MKNISAISAIPKLSQTGKMPCASWSLQARETCPGSMDSKGELVPACAGCYAATGTYYFQSVKAPRLHNREDWHRLDWTDAMIDLLSDMDYFRWFDSGDVYHYRLALKILEVMKATPDTMHWLPTRSYKVPRIRTVLRHMAALNNVTVRYSSDAIDGSNTALKHARKDYVQTSIIDHVSRIDRRVKSVCKAYQRTGKCGDCRTCWNKEIETITYPQHGKMMAKIERINQ